MKIGPYSAINQVQSTGKVNKVTEKEKTKVTDSLEISNAGKEYQVAKKAVTESPDIRQDLVDDIKRRIDNNTYDVSDEDVVDKMISKLFD